MIRPMKKCHGVQWERMGRLTSAWCSATFTLSWSLTLKAKLDSPCPSYDDGLFLTEKRACAKALRLKQAQYAWGRQNPDVYRLRAHVVRGEAGQADSISSLGPEVGDQIEALRHLLWYVLRSNRRIWNKEMTVALSLDRFLWLMRQMDWEKGGREENRAPARLWFQGSRGEKTWCSWTLQEVGRFKIRGLVWLHCLRSSHVHQFFRLILVDPLWGPHPPPTAWPRDTFVISSHSLRIIPVPAFLCVFLRSSLLPDCPVSVLSCSCQTPI